jgi:hypothetical protein
MSISLSPLLSQTASCRIRTTLWPRSYGAADVIYFSAGHRAGALFKNRSAGIAEIGLVLPQAVLDSGGIGNVARAEPEGVGHTRRPLPGRAAILLRRGSGNAKRCCQDRDVRTRGFRKDHSC